MGFACLLHLLSHNRKVPLVLYCTVGYCTVLYCIAYMLYVIMYCTLLYSTTAISHSLSSEGKGPLVCIAYMLYCTVLYCIVLYTLCHHPHHCNLHIKSYIYDTIPPLSHPCTPPLYPPPHTILTLYHHHPYKTKHMILYHCTEHTDYSSVSSGATHTHTHHP